MGDAVAAIAGGTHAIELNPAGVARAVLPMIQTGLGLNPSTLEFQFNTSILYPFQDGTVFALSQFSDFPKSPTSSTTYIGTVALPLNSERDFFLGVNLKYLALSEIDNGILEGGQGLGLDFGLAYDLRGPQGTIASFGLAARDVNTEVRFNNTIEQPVTRTFVLGAAYQGIPDTRVEMDYDIVDQTLQYTGMQNQFRLGAERFFADRFYSLRVGYDALFSNNGNFSIGAGFHPNQPYEICYALQLPADGGGSTHFLSFVWRFEETGPKANQAITQIATSSEINIGNLNRLIEQPTNAGNPVSGVPLRKMTIQTDPEVFSPLGRQKTTAISFPGDEAPDIARWLVTIESPDKTPVRQFAGTGPLVSFVWDGLRSDGKPVREGKYQVALKTFNDKDQLISDDASSVDILAPRAHFEIQTANIYFSTRAPKNGKGGLAFTVNPGGPPDVQTWDFEISAVSTNKVVFEKQGKARLPKTLRWDGTDLDGDVAPNGAYLCLLVAQDQAGNPIKTDALQVFLENNPPDLALEGQSPWADFRSGTTFSFNLNAADEVGIAEWKMTLRSEKGEVLKSFAAAGQPPAKVAWDGTTNQGKALGPGSFMTAVFSATDKAGNTADADPVHVQVDYHPPSGQEQMTLDLATVYFNAMSSDLTDSAKKEIDQAAASIKPYVNKSVLVVKGYTSSTETGDTLALSHARALEVKNYLMKSLGLPDDSIYALGYADREPLQTSPKAVTEDPQRRAVITLTTLQ